MSDRLIKQLDVAELNKIRIALLLAGELCYELEDQRFVEAFFPLFLRYGFRAFEEIQSLCDADKLSTWYLMSYLVHRRQAMPSLIRKAESDILAAFYIKGFDYHLQGSLDLRTKAFWHGMKRNYHLKKHIPYLLNNYNEVEFVKDVRAFSEIKFSPTEIDTLAYTLPIKMSKPDAEALFEEVFSYLNFTIKTNLINPQIEPENIALLWRNIGRVAGDSLVQLLERPVISIDQIGEVFQCLIKTGGITSFPVTPGFLERAILVTYKSGNADAEMLYNGFHLGLLWGSHKYIYVDKDSL